MELFDLARRKLGTIREIVVAEENPLEQYLRIIVESQRKLIAEVGIPRSKILGMGIGVPGIVGHNGQVSVAAPMWDWESVSLLVMIEQRTQLPVYIDNGAKAMALAESWFGAGRGVQDMVVILIGTGIGAGIITKGALYRGATNSAGEWGHTKISLKGRPCRCGSQGCLEAYAGAPGIIASLHEMAHQPQPEVQEDQLSTLNGIVQAYKRQEPLATQVMQFTAQILGAGIANLVNLFNPELIVIGGWAGLLVGEAILEDLNRYVKEYALPLSAMDLQIGLCQFGQDAICTGAACLVLEEFLSANLKFNRPELEMDPVTT
jgi:predicted NBD/HSP70 family sugar kinase